MTHSGLTFTTNRPSLGADHWIPRSGGGGYVFSFWENYVVVFFILKPNKLFFLTPPPLWIYFLNMFVKNIGFYAPSEQPLNKSIAPPGGIQWPAPWGMPSDYSSVHDRSESLTFLGSGLRSFLDRAPHSSST